MLLFYRLIVCQAALTCFWTCIYFYQQRSRWICPHGQVISNSVLGGAANLRRDSWPSSYIVDTNFYWNAKKIKGLLNKLISFYFIMNSIIHFVLQLKAQLNLPRIKQQHRIYNYNPMFLAHIYCWLTCTTICIICRHSSIHIVCIHQGILHFFVDMSHNILLQVCILSILCQLFFLFCPTRSCRLGNSPSHHRSDNQ